MATIQELLDRHEPRLRAAFLAAIDEITSKAQIEQIARALERGDLNAAIEAIYLDSAAFAAFEKSIAEAFEEGGAGTIDGLGRIRDATGTRFVIRFNGRNLRAESILREFSSELVTRIVQEQRDVIRSRLEDGMQRGDNPRTVALDITGRINRVTGRREGGIVGLSAPQEAYVRRAREELESGNYSAYLERTRRDKRFDRTVAKAEREGKPLTQAQIQKMVARYSDSLLKLRGETIGRTEALASLHRAQYEALQQVVDTGKVSANQIRRIWDATGDRRTRFAHALADGQSVGLNDAFEVGGRRMMYPGDPLGGPENVINCRCAVKIRIDYLANLQ